MSERLLKRLRQWNDDESVQMHQLDSQDYVESVRLDIEQLLNTRQGTVLINNDLGLPELTHLFNGFSLPEVDNLQLIITKQIQLFEPRLSTIAMQFIGDQGKEIQLLFQLTAQLKSDQQAIPFSVSIKLKENGSVSVSS